MDLFLLAFSLLAVGGFILTHDSDDDIEANPEPEPEPETPDFPPFSYTHDPTSGEAAIEGSDAADLAGSGAGLDADSGAYHQLIDHLDAQDILAGSLDLGGGDDALSLGGSNAYTADATLSGGDGDDSITIDETRFGTLDGGAGDDTLTLDMRASPYESADDGSGTLVEFTGSDAVLTGGDGADLFEINADIQLLHDEDATLTLATISDFDPAADSLVLDIDGLAEGDYPDGTYSALPDGYSLTGPDVVADVRLTEAVDGSYTDIVITAQSLAGEGETAITQDFAVRLEGVSGLDPALLSFDPATMEIRLA